MVHGLILSGTISILLHMPIWRNTILLKKAMKKKSLNQKNNIDLPSNVAPFLSDLFNQLNSEEVEYCVMRNYDSLPNSLGGSDLDILIAPEDEVAVREIVFRSIDRANGTAIGCSSTLGFFKVFAFGCNREAGNLWWGVRIDVNVGYSFRGIMVIDFKESLKLRTTHNGIKVLENGFAAVLGVIKEVLNNGQMPARYRRDASLSVQDDWERLSLTLAPMGDQGLSLFRQIILAESSEDEVAKQSRTLRRALFIQAFRNSPVAFIYARFLHEWAKVRRYLRPSGVIVAALGVDGVGKSTVINAIKPVLDDATHGALEIKHLRPGLLPPLKGMQAAQIGPVLEPHGSKPSGTLGSLFRLFYLTADYVLGYWLLLRPKIAKSPTVILFDRYCYDMALDPRRFRLEISRCVIEWFLHLIPKPDVVLCLHAEPEVILVRKQELPLAELTRQANALREFAQREPRAILVSTEGTIEEVRDNTLGLLQTRLSNRFLQSWL